ncbi:hypothetical protein NE857_25830 [Nocardiopsis exhalans]|uniref:Uncharacterized protein n=1 Tax=Nocardiopsis exhalans TaxID=163604 RepID=A0ABY5D6Z6_9ACTN|nr:hypothetical protein [Nocardiopsis exhalans]USY18680.1 hypothetical protein NE857_25830 [Nocardiopsis exhalans]
MSHEAGLASYSLRGGLRSLRKANYEKPMNYYGGFFQYTIGLERIMKLALIVDYVAQNKTFPNDNQYIKQYGHKINNLLDGIQDIRERIEEPSRVWKLPEKDLTDAAVKFLTNFAQSARYYNIDVLTGKEATQDPVKVWFSTVGKKLLAKRKGSPPSAEWARALDSDLGDSLSFRFETETGEPIRGLEAAIRAKDDSEYVAKEGTFLCSRIARHAISVLTERSNQVPHEVEIPDFSEFFHIFIMDDAYLKRQKVFTG